jgi:hypothetical protein
MEVAGAVASDDGVRVNTMLKSLILDRNHITNVGVHEIADALFFNHTQFDMQIKDSYGRLLVHEEHVTDSFHNLGGLLHPLNGEDGAQMLGREFQIKCHFVTLE